jgi:hypothetical protein
MRPIFDRLPRLGYQDNLPTDWLTSFWDQFTVGLKTKVDKLPLDLAPATAPEGNLDFLAALFGFTDGYWEPSWDPATKRDLLGKGLGWLWPRRGTMPVLTYIVNLFFGRGADVWTEGSFFADLSSAEVETLGNPLFRYFLRLPLRGLDQTRAVCVEGGTTRGRSTWSLAVRLNRLYGPAFADSDVVYEEFYAEFSAAGDPVFTDFEDLQVAEVVLDSGLPYLL